MAGGLTSSPTAAMQTAMAEGTAAGTAAGTAGTAANINSTRRRRQLGSRRRPAIPGLALECRRRRHQRTSRAEATVKGTAARDMGTVIEMTATSPDRRHMEAISGATRAIRGSITDRRPRQARIGAMTDHTEVIAATGVTVILGGIGSSGV